MQGRRARWLRRNLTLVVGIGCAIALVIEAIVIAFPASPSIGTPADTGLPSGALVSVLGVDLIPTYVTSNTSDTNFLSETDCGCEPVTAEPGNSFTWWVLLGNSDRGAHHLTRVSVDAPFTLLGSNPEPTVVLPPGGSVNITLEVGVPSTGGEYDMTGAIFVD